MDRRHGDDEVDVLSEELAAGARPAFDILLVLAPPRSFTTVLSTMLGQHPQLYGVPETYFFTCDSVEEWTTRYRGTNRMNGALRAVAQVVFGQQTPPTINLARQWLQARSHRSTSEVLRLLSRRVAPRVLVEKTPAASERLEPMQRMLREFPCARFLHVTRHPCAQARSRLERRMNAGTTDGPTSLVEAAQRLGEDPAQLWLTTHQTIMRFLQDVPDDQQLSVRGEDVLAGPDQELRHIAQWLGIRADADAIDAMKHPERSFFADVGPDNAPRGGDETFFAGPVLRRQSSEVPRLDAPVPWGSDGVLLTDDVRRLATHFGYE